MSEKNCARKEGTNEELGEHTIRDSNRVPLDELLVNSTVPSTTVPVKVCDDSADEGGRDNNDKQKRGILTNFQRRTFSRISFKGESGPLLSRWIFLFFLFSSFFIVEWNPTSSRWFRWFDDNDHFSIITTTTTSTIIFLLKLTYNLQIYTIGARYRYRKYFLS